MPLFQPDNLIYGSKKIIQPRTVTKGKERGCSAAGAGDHQSIQNFRCDEICHNIIIARASNNFTKAENKAVISFATGQNVYLFPAINNIPTAATDNDIIAGKALDQFGGCYSTVTDFARFRGWSTSVPLATAA